MRSFTRKTDSRGRVTLPSDFASCEVIVECDRYELRIRKVGAPRARRYTFKELMAQVTEENIQPGIDA